MAFYAYLKQAGDGCDYTIGCGLRFYEIEGATSFDEAQKKVIAQLLYPDLKTEPDQNSRYHVDGEGALESVVIFEVQGHVSVDLRSAWGARDAELRAQEEAVSRVQSEARERAEFERLKAKFGG